MSGKQKNLRLPQATLEQIKWLAERYTTEATVVAVAVRKLYDAEQKVKHPTVSPTAM